MRKLLVWLLVLAIFAGVLSSCNIGNKEFAEPDGAETGTETEKIKETEPESETEKETETEEKEVRWAL